MHNDFREDSRQALLWHTGSPQLDNGPLVRVIKRRLRTRQFDVLIETEFDLLRDLFFLESSTNTMKRDLEVKIEVEQGSVLIHLNNRKVSYSYHWSSHLNLHLRNNSCFTTYSRRSGNRYLSTFAYIRFYFLICSIRPPLFNFKPGWVSLTNGSFSATAFLRRLRILKYNHDALLIS